MPRASRCSFKQHGRRCTRDGHGDPPLCPPHRIALEEVSRPRAPAEVIAEGFFDFLQGKPINGGDILGAVQSVASQWAGMADQYRPPVEGAHDREGRVHQRGAMPLHILLEMFRQQAQAPGRSTPPPAQEPVALHELRAAKKTMGFAESEPLDANKLRDRHRTLSKKYHPDLAPPERRNALTEKMKAINRARDVLSAAMDAGISL